MLMHKPTVLYWYCSETKTCPALAHLLITVISFIPNMLETCYFLQLVVDSYKKKICFSVCYEEHTWRLSNLNNNQLTLPIKMLKYWEAAICQLSLPYCFCQYLVTTKSIPTTHIYMRHGKILKWISGKTALRLQIEKSKMCLTEFIGFASSI